MLPCTWSPLPCLRCTNGPCAACHKVSCCSPCMLVCLAQCAAWIALPKGVHHAQGVASTPQHPCTMYTPSRGSSVPAPLKPRPCRPPKSMATRDDPIEGLSGCSPPTLHNAPATPPLCPPVRLWRRSMPAGCQCLEERVHTHTHTHRRRESSRDREKERRRERYAFIYTIHTYVVRC